jgi:hypothetical protein
VGLLFTSYYFSIIARSTHCLLLSRWLVTLPPCSAFLARLISQAAVSVDVSSAAEPRQVVLEAADTAAGGGVVSLDARRPAAWVSVFAWLPQEEVSGPVDCRQAVERFRQEVSEPGLCHHTGALVQPPCRVKEAGSPECRNSEAE